MPLENTLGPLERERVAQEEATGQSVAPLDLSTLPSAFLEHHLVAAMNGAITFELAPGHTVDLDTLAAEYHRRSSASEFNRP